MITIIHGDDVLSSRNYLLEEKNKSTSNFAFEGKNMILNDLIQVIESEGLFTDTKTIFIENFLAEFLFNETVA